MHFLSFDLSLVSTSNGQDLDGEYCRESLSLLCNTASAWNRALYQVTQETKNGPNCKILDVGNFNFLDSSCGRAKFDRPLGIR